MIESIHPLSLPHGLNAIARVGSLLMGSLGRVKCGCSPQLLRHLRTVSTQLAFCSLLARLVGDYVHLLASVPTVLKPGERQTTAGLSCAAGCTAAPDARA